jgi:photosystem II stability/assembly factor-like uncharacterized protein
LAVDHYLCSATLLASTLQAATSDPFLHIDCPTISHLAANFSPPNLYLMARIFIFFFGLCLLSSLWACREPVALTPLDDALMLAPQADLRAVAFAGEVGYAVGGDRYATTTLLRSNDGGQNWRSQPPYRAVERSMYCLLVRDEQSALAAGLHNEVLRTVDGGQTWLPGPLPDFVFEVPVHAMALVDDSTVMMVCGGGYDTGVWYRSSDFGLHWEVADTVDFDLRDIVFTSPQVGYTSGYGVIFKTTDGGNQWALTPAEDDFFIAMAFPSPQVGYAVGRTGTILKTTDAAASWQRLRNGNNFLLPRHRYWDVAFLNEQIGYVAGDEGLLLKTTDGGDSWERLDTGTKADIYGISVQSEGRGVLVGERGLLSLFEE